MNPDDSWPCFRPPTSGVVACGGCDFSCPAGRALRSGASAGGRGDRGRLAQAWGDVASLGTVADGVDEDVHRMSCTTKPVTVNSRLGVRPSVEAAKLAKLLL